MTRGNASCMRVSNPKVNIQKTKAQNNGQSIHQIEEEIEENWESMPNQAKKFLLESLGSINLHRLAEFWSSPMVIDYTRGGIAETVGGYSLFIALNYLKLGKVRESQALVLNGSFLLQCANTPIEAIVELCEENLSTPIMDIRVPLFSRCYHSVRTPQMIEAYLQEKLSSEKQHMMESFVKTRSNHVKEYVSQIGDDWNGYSSSSHQKPSSKTSTGAQIQIILVGDTNEEERHSFSIGSSTTLKTLFNDYAEKRGVSLRSLRFSYGGKTLFLSTVGNRTPDELNIRDQDIITVHDTNVSQEASSSSSKAPQEAGSSSSKQRNKLAPKNVKTTKKSTNKTKGKDEMKKKSKKEEPTKTLEEHKAHHSTMLSKLHEEVQPRLKEIRMRLNTLELERQPSKQKRKNKRKKKTKVTYLDTQVLPNPGIGGKAGKPYFIVQVGEVQNLYRTTKSSQKSSSSVLSTLDLHGCTRDEALVKLDEILAAWVDTAMEGSYPFVIPAKIVCGCGNQVLSETVEKWIREHAQVANAPKNSIS